MKKLLLVLAVAFSATIANAQRTIDWAVDTVYVADTIKGVANGSAVSTSFSVNFVLKNLGTDTVKPGDTIFFNILLVNAANNSIITGYPQANQGVFSTRVVNKSYVTGDTAQVNLGALTINTAPPQSINIFFVVQSYIMNRPNGIAIEGQATSTNNANVKNVVWLSQYGFGVGLKEELANVKLSVYPNPASEAVNFDIDYNDAKTVEIMDLAGRKVDAADFGMNTATVDVRNYTKGIYLYQITNKEGQVIKNGKFSVN